MQLLISVAGPAEARAALHGGADVIDAKDPRRGALGPVSVPRLAAIRAAVAGARPLSAAVGDATSEYAVAESVAAALSVGVAFVKLGLAGVTSEARADRLAGAARRALETAVVTRLVLVAYADWRSATSSWPRSSAVTMRCSTPCGSVRRKYESTIVFESSACAGLINTTRRAPSCPASQAAMVSLVTSQECGSGSAARSQWYGASTGSRPSWTAALIPPSPSTSAASGRRAASACAYWSIPSTAIQCAASSPILTRLNIRRTASANGPPPGSTTRRRPRRNALRASITSSKAPAVP